MTHWLVLLILGCTILCVASGILCYTSVIRFERRLNEYERVSARVFGGFGKEVDGLDEVDEEPVQVKQSVAATADLQTEGLLVQANKFPLTEGQMRVNMPKPEWMKEREKKRSA